MYKKIQKQHDCVESVSAESQKQHWSHQCVISVWMYGRVSVCVMLIRFAVNNGCKESLWFFYSWNLRRRARSFIKHALVDVAMNKVWFPQLTTAVQWENVKEQKRCEWKFSHTEEIWAILEQMIMTIMPLAPIHRWQLNVGLQLSNISYNI